MKISATKKGLRQETVHCRVGFNSEIDVPALSHVQVRESLHWRRMWTACLNVIDFFWASTFGQRVVIPRIVRPAVQESCPRQAMWCRAARKPSASRIPVHVRGQKELTKSTRTIAHKASRDHRDHRASSTRMIRKRRPAPKKLLHR